MSDSHNKVFLTLEEIKPLYLVNGILDGTKGGLILGNSHNDFGIKLLRESDGNRFEIIGEVEGWEYLLNPEASVKYRKELDRINSELAKSKSDFCEYSIPDNVDILNAEPIIKQIKITSRFILMGEYSQFVVNKYSTKKYLSQLDRMNKNRINTAPNKQ